MASKTIRYEDNTEESTVTGWVCKTCRRFYGADDRMARWCCATELPCVCGGRVEKNWTLCATCRQKKDDEKWFKRERRAWIGEPLFSETLDRFLFDADDVHDAITDAGGDAESLRLVICDPVYGRLLDDDYFQNELPEDWTIRDASEEIADAVDALNDVIRKRDKPLSWFPGKFAATFEENKSEDAGATPVNEGVTESA